MSTAVDNGRQAANEHMIAQLSEFLVQRIEFARRHGLAYEGDRDIYKVGGYKRTLTFDDFRGLYERDGIARRIVNMPAETTWRGAPEITLSGRADAGEFTRAVENLAKRLGLWRRLERADRMSRLGRYAVLFIGVRGTDQRLEEPMPTLRAPDDVLYLSAFNEHVAKVKTWISDTRDPRYGMPELYEIDFAGELKELSGSRQGTGTRRVHHTRIIHVVEDLEDDEVFGRPVLEPIYNDLVDLQKIKTSSSEAFWQRVAGILGLKIDPEAVGVDETILKQVDEQLAQLYHDLRRTFLMQGGELYRLAESEPEPEEAADLLMTVIAAGAGIPKRILFGSETGERASSEDQKTYLGMIRDRQITHAEPGILRPFIDRLIQHNALPKPGADGYEVVWPPLFQESEKDIADANLARARIARELTPVGGDPLTLVEIDDDRNVWPRPTGDRGALTPAELEPPEPPEPPGPPTSGGIAEDDEELEEP